MKKLLSDPYVLFLVMAAMFFEQIKNPNDHFVQDTVKNNLSFIQIHSVVSEEEMFEVLLTTTVTDYHTPSDGNKLNGQQLGELTR